MRYAIAFALLAAATASAAVAQRSRSVLIGADPQLDACPTTGEVQGLNPRGDNYLSVRASPRSGAREVGRLRRGQMVWICESGGYDGWYGIVYGRWPAQDCRLGSPVPRQRPYSGSCGSGWVSARYIRVVAG
jgi:hypothetical protein